MTNNRAVLIHRESISGILVLIVGRVTVIIASKCVPRKMEYYESQHSGKNSQHIEHYTGNVATQGNTVEGLSSVLVARVVSQDVTLMHGSKSIIGQHCHWAKLFSGHKT